MAAELAGKTTFMTGAGSGLGRESAILFAEEGSRVVVTDLNLDGANETVEIIRGAGGEAIATQLDVTEEASIAEAVRFGLAEFGHFDCAVNNAAVPPDAKRIHELDADHYDLMFRVNTRGVALSMKYELQHLLQRGSGAIVNIGSTRSFRAMPGSPGYGTTKFGVIGLSETAALEYGADNIRVNVVCPGVMNTPMVQARRAVSDESEVDYVNRVGGVLQRIGEPREVAQASLWLCSDRASYVTGHTMVVDGGYRVR